MALLSIMGLYQYDRTIFDNIQLPEALDRETLISDILLECAELETFISDPEVLKEALGYWSKKNLDNWQHIYDAMTEKYDPLWNKDGTYTETETRDLKTSGQETRNLASTADSTGQVSAYNSNNFQNQNRQSASGSDTGTINNIGSDTGTVTRTRRETGNIGVTTSQQMLTEEINLRRQFNIYDIITEDFKSRFCLMVY